MAAVQGDSHFDAFVTDWEARSDPESLRSWLRVMHDCPGIATAMEYATVGGAYNGTIRSNFWNIVEATESAGRVPDRADLADAPDPLLGDVDAGAFITRGEAYDILPRKWAHALWVEKSRFFPWRLNDEPELGLRWLFYQDFIFHNGAEDETTSVDWTSAAQCAGMVYCMDHSPYRAWDVMGTGSGGFMENFTGRLQKDASRLIIQDLASQYTHWAPPDDRNTGIHLDDWHDVTINKTQIGGAARAYFTARGGCQGSGPALTAWHRAINIPATIDRHVFAGTGHCSTVIMLDKTAYVVGHADHMYGSWTRETYPSEVPWWGRRSPIDYLWPYNKSMSGAGWGETWASVKSVYPFNDPERINYSDRQLQRMMAGGKIVSSIPGRMHPVLIDYYENNGWSATLSVYGSNSTSANDAIKARLIKITGQDIP